MPAYRTLNVFIILFFPLVDTPLGEGYTFNGLLELNQYYLVTNIGFLCRGLLPEYLWMNIPEAFILRYLFTDQELMDSSAQPKGVFSSTVLDNRPIRECYWRMHLSLDPEGSRAFAEVRPGQFAEFDISAAGVPPIDQVPERLRDHLQHQVLLRRPFSFSDVSVSWTDEGQIVKMEILYCVLGPATVRMMTLKPGDRVSIIGPLGNGFWYPDGMKHAVLIAGGMGAPPLQHLADYLRRQFPQVSVTAFAGARSCEDLPFTLRIGNKTGIVLQEFDRLGVPSFIATDDGSAGCKGYVTDAAAEWIEANGLDPAETVLYACGPEPMLAQCDKLSRQTGIPCQVSMERMMACGIGLCQSCAVEVKKDKTEETEYKLCCKDGPVFDSRNVIYLKH